jgi:hypothetical protein
MANVIIGVHGLGNKPSDQLLRYWWKLAMEEGLKTIERNVLLPEFKMAYWSDLIHERHLDPGETDPDSLYFIDEKYEKAPENHLVEDYSTRIKVIDFLGRQMNRIFLNEDLTLNYSFISDTIINKYFTDLEVYYTGNITGKDNKIHKAKNMIRERLYSRLKKYENHNIMLISHSMGSIIAFEVLTFLAPEIKINTFITMGSPLGLPAVISKIADEYKQRGKELNKLTTPPGIINNWYNFSDILDNVAFNYKLSDSYSENDYGVKPIDILVTNNYESNGIRNPHKSFGYLRTTEFSKILYDFILEEKLSFKQKVSRQIIRVTDNIKSLVNPRKRKEYIP